MIAPQSVHTLPSDEIYDSTHRPPAIIEELGEVWRYRDLLAQLVVRNVKIRYKRSVLGIGWTMLHPLLMMLILTLVFSNVFRISLEHYAVYVLSALLLWNFFAQATSDSMSELVWGGGLLHRIYLPRSVFALSAVGTGLVNLIFAIGPLALIMLVTGVAFKPVLFFLLVPILLTAMFALGIGLIFSVLAARFADVAHIYQILLTAWMYLTPIIYPTEIIPDQYRWAVNLNPMYYLVETFRAPIYGGVFPSFSTLVTAVLVSVATLLLGWGFFTQKADELAYRV